MSPEFDFVVVGGGTAGCLLASRLANTTAKPSVALLEGGPAINKPEYRRAFERFKTVYEHVSLDYGYMSVPQASCHGRLVPQNRGKGLGGSSAVNFETWSFGAREEFDAWAATVGDECWGFESMSERLRQLENLHLGDLKEEWREYVNPDPEYHGYSGPIDVTIGHVEKETKTFIDAGTDLGHQRNLDPNDGNPVGFSLGPTSTANGIRTTSASAFLEKGVPSTLSIQPDSRVVKILFEGKRATGVVKENGTKIFARKEVIVSAGAIDSPRLLLLSGVGPKDELQALGISIVTDLDGVGKHFTDHPTVPVTFLMGSQYTIRIKTMDNYQEALEQMSRDGAGPLREHFLSSPHAFLKNPEAYASPEFKGIPKDTQELLLKPGVPSYELVAGPLIPPTFKFDSPEDGYCTTFVAIMNPTSEGTLKLSSSNPGDAPLIDPKYLDNPYDLVNLRGAVREAIKMMETPSMKDHYVKPIFAPRSQSDEDIEEFIRANVSGLWHPSCSVKMGRSAADGSCVGADLKVHGLDGLRVADLSVTPNLPSGHPQIVAYAIGQIAAEKITKEYGL